ncbi:MerR family transcriptional regulator [Candidatus Rariloculus sp.]|uniref:MerR family transcriptional regulator n=1 Tax=Candidatus Rariloculus sp. TaxID=3101265 RepID=UPI003D138B98
MTPTHEYSTQRAAELTGLLPEQIRRWARAGFVAQQKRARAHWHYSFQDLALLRSARSLLDARFSPNRVTRTLHRLRDQSRRGTPLSAMRILVTAQQIVFSDRSASWEPETLQETLDFDLRARSEPAATRIQHHAH